MSYASIIATLNNDHLYNATLLLAKSLGRVAETEMVADALNQYYAACVERGINMSKINAELE